MGAAVWDPATAWLWEPKDTAWSLAEAVAAHPPPPKPAVNGHAKRKRKVPDTVECPECGRIIRTHNRAYLTHSTSQTGPECILSRKPVTDESLRFTANVRRARTVMNWAHVLRDDDPERVRRWMASVDRAELEALMMTALAAIPDGMSLGAAYGWVRGLGA